MKILILFIALGFLYACSSSKTEDNKSQTTEENVGSEQENDIVQNENIPEDWIEYSASSFSLYYPPSWEIVKGDGVIKFTIYPPEDLSSETNREKVNFIEQDTQGQISDFDQYMEDQQKEVKKFYEKYELLEFEKITDSKDDYYRELRTTTIQGFDRKTLHCTWYKDEILYILTFTTPENTYKNFEKEFEKILLTVEIF